jgi:chaperonin GroEL (HSP60 family)
MSNAGKKINLFQRYPIGYDVKEYKEVDMFEAGILDTAKGIKTLINAVSLK